MDCDRICLYALITTTKNLTEGKSDIFVEKKGVSHRVYAEATLV